MPGSLRKLNVAAGEVEAGDIVVAVQNIDVTNTIVKRVVRGAGINGGYVFHGPQRHRPSTPNRIGVADFQRISVLRWVEE